MHRKRVDTLLAIAKGMNPSCPSHRMYPYLIQQRFRSRRSSVPHLKCYEERLGKECTDNVPVLKTRSIASCNIVPKSPLPSGVLAHRVMSTSITLALVDSSTCGYVSKKRGTTTGPK